MEVALSSRQAKSATRNPPADPRHEPRQPAVRRSPDPRRTPQARHRCGSDLGGQIYGKTQETSIARMEDVSVQPRRWDRRNGSLRRSDNFLSVSLWLGDFKSWPAPDPVAGRDGPSNGRMDGPTSYRSLRVGWDARISGSGL